MSDSSRLPIVLISTSDTDLLAARSCPQTWRLATAIRTKVADLPELTDGAACVVVRLLGGRQAWPEGVDWLVAQNVPVVFVSGEPEPDAVLHEMSTVPAGVASQVHEYLAEGGVDNLANLANFLHDTLRLSGFGFEPPKAMPSWGVHCDDATDASIIDLTNPQPIVGIVFYRAHALAGNTAFIDDLADAVRRRGARPLAIYVSSLRGVTPEAEPELFAQLQRCDVLVTSILASGGAHAALAQAGGREDAWDAGMLRALNVPVLQAMSLLVGEQTWRDSDAALIPLDATNNAMMPEFDGRIITVPFAFKEVDADGLAKYVTVADRCDRIADIAFRHGQLRSVPVDQRKVAVMLTAYPTKHSRIGNAVGLDSAASIVALLGQLRDAGYDIGDVDLEALGKGMGIDGADLSSSDGIIHRLIAAGGYDVDYLTADQSAQALAMIPADTYASWLGQLPSGFADEVTQAWGEAPGTLYTDESGAIALCGLRFGNVVVMVQPPRGFGDNIIAIYHDPDMPPSHHYTATYAWLSQQPEHGGFGAHAIVHVGKHGTLEWLPGKGVGLSAECPPDAVLGGMPVVYPFLVNDPGEGSAAKRRAHAVLIDHLIPPMARAETYGDLAKLEQLLDEYAHVADLDPAKVNAVQEQIWTLVRTAQLHHDLGTQEMPEDFDEFVMHIDGYLCEIKDVQIRDGLHVLGQNPTGTALINTTLAVARANQMWDGQRGAILGLRAAIAAVFNVSEADLVQRPGAALTDQERVGVKRLVASLGVDLPAVSGADALDVLEVAARRLVCALDARGWPTDGVEGVVADVLPDAASDRHVLEASRFLCTEVVPRLLKTSNELTNVVRALDGQYIDAGPSGSPTRGLVNVLPTGRNFYSVDPRAIPTRNAWDTGVSLAESVIARHRQDHGTYPANVGITVWGTAVMRTQGDDVAEIMALLGVRPTWHDASRRVTGFEIIDLAELGRPRVDVTVRISGFFRDAFPHVVNMLDDIVCAVADLDEPADMNPLRANVLHDMAAHGDKRRATSRIFGSAPGAYGAGLLQLMESGNWRDDADIAEVYAVWGGYAYGRNMAGRPARDDMETTYRRIQVAVKNADTSEHDILDSDDYYQYHGGMVATVKHLTGAAPQAYVGDSAVPEQIRTRTLHEETHRVFRARVVNPQWISAMQRHGYKGAFEMAATVDYLYGFAATTDAVGDWMFESIAQEYVANEAVAQFMQESNPWARQHIAERLLDAAQRGLWTEPDQDTLDMLTQAVLDTEGALEG